MSREQIDKYHWEGKTAYYL